MKIKLKIHEILKDSNKFYVIARCLNNMRMKEYIYLIKGYYEETYDYTSMLAVHNGEMYPDRLVYYIPSDVLKENQSIGKSTVGFCAKLRRTLEALNFSDLCKFTPVVEWGKNTAYYDPGMNRITQNVFEYYFEPVSDIDYREIIKCKNVIESHSGNGTFLMRHATFSGSYEVNQSEIDKLGVIFKKYIHLNKTTREYIEGNMRNVLTGESILAVHVRGTDFNCEIKYHPHAITTEQYLSKTKELCAGGRYKKVFLATDDASVLEMFKQEFPDKLVYYEDVFRTENHIGPHGTPSERPLHYYKLGLEVLRDVYTLANCDSLLCGLSQVAFAVRYVNVALERKFGEIVILNNGMNDKDSAEAKKYRRKRNNHKLI